MVQGVKESAGGRKESQVYKFDGEKLELPGAVVDANGKKIALIEKVESKSDRILRWLNEEVCIKNNADKVNSALQSGHEKMAQAGAKSVDTIFEKKNNLVEPAQIRNK